MDEKNVAENAVEILLVEDNPRDAELTLRALKKSNLANKVYVVEDGEKALNYIFANGDYAHRNMAHAPKVILLDLKLPKVDGLRSCGRSKRMNGQERSRSWYSPLRGRNGIW